MNTSEARMMYDDLGYTTMPLRRRNNKPSLKGWPRLTTQELWQDAPPDSNIALRAGGGIAFVDCDEKNAAGTVENITRWLASVGYLADDYPFVQTASGIGRHVYISFSGGLDGHARQLSPAVGAGEFRYGPGAYVVAPPSAVRERPYQLIGGDLRQRPRLDLADILPLLKNQDTQTQPPADYVPKAGAIVPRAAWNILKGRDMPGKYHSDSEREQALVLTLINAGIDFNGIHVLFSQHTANLPSFAKHCRNGAQEAQRWLMQSFNTALRIAAQPSPGRALVRRYREWALADSWSGRTGSYDRAVYLAGVDIAERAGSVQCGLSAREAAEGAGVGTMTASRAIKRLMLRGLIRRCASHTASRSTRYELLPPPQSVNSGTIPHIEHVWDCISIDTSSVISHDVFRWAGFGKSAAQVWALLQAGPLTVGELIDKSGRCRNTIKTALKRMSNLADESTGEYMPMVEQDGGGAWHALPVDLDAIAELLGVAGIGARQKAEHKRQREANRYQLEKGRERRKGGVEICHG